MGRTVISPQFALTAGFAAAFGQLRNAPHLPNEDFDDVSHRFGAFYARRSARYSAEAIAGYLHHEDPRFRPSVERGFWHRTESAAMNVITTPGDDGTLRVAYAPIAGAFSSALVRGAVYRQTNFTAGNILLHSAGVYSFYFARDFFREFRPELDVYARRLLRRGK